MTQAPMLPMTIKNVRAENVKRLRLVEVRPEGFVVIISGRNAQGKTSLLDAIMFALGGGKALRGCTRPIREGETRASVVLDLGEMVVTRSWTAKGTKLEVLAKDGSKIKSPQTLLDKLIGPLSFDPRVFAELPAKERVAALLKVAEITIDPAALDAKHAKVFEDRTAVNREVKELDARLKAMPMPAKDLPAKPVSFSDLLTELKEAQAMHTSAQAAAEHLAACERAVDEAGAVLDAAEAALTAAQEAKEELPEVLPNLAAIEASLADIEKINDGVRAAEKRMEVATLLTKAKCKSSAFSEELLRIDGEKERGLREAKMPIKGLGFDANGITFEGQSFEDASEAQRLRVSMAIAIAMNPTIRIVRIKDASLMDEECVALVAEMAEAAKCQVWLEMVRTDGQVCIVIEDGRIAA